MSFNVDVTWNGGPAKAGKTLHTVVLATDGSIVAGTRDTAILGEVSTDSGSYLVSATFTDGQRGFLVLYLGTLGIIATDLNAVTVYQAWGIGIADENPDVKTSTRGTSTFAGGAVASVTAPVALTGAYDAAKTAAAPGAAMTLANGALTGAAIAAGAINSSKFTVGAITGLASATGLLERLTAIWRWCFKAKLIPLSRGTATSGNIEYYDDDDTTVIGKQAEADDGSSQQTLGAIQDGP